MAAITRPTPGSWTPMVRTSLHRTCVARPCATDQGRPPRSPSAEFARRKPSPTYSPQASPGRRSRTPPPNMEPQDKIQDKIPQVDPYSGEANRALQEAGDRADTVRPPSLATASPSREAVHLPGPAGEGGPASTSYPPAWHLSGSPGPRRRDRGPRQPCPTSAVRYPACGAGRELRGHLHHPPRHLL